MGSLCSTSLPPPSSPQSPPPSPSLNASLEDQIAAELLLVRAEVEKSGGVNHITPPALPTDDTLFELRTTLSDLTNLAYNTSLSVAESARIHATLGEFIELLDRWNAGKSLEEGMASPRSGDERVVEELFEFMPKVTSLKEAIGTATGSTATGVQVPLLSIPRLTTRPTSDVSVAATLATLERDCNYHKWLAELPTSFVYKGCRPNMDYAMADTVKATLKEWGFVLRGEVWTKPYWWVLSEPTVDYMLLRWVAVKRIERRNEDNTRKGVRENKVYMS